MFGGFIIIFVIDIGKYIVGRLWLYFFLICKVLFFVFMNCSYMYILDDVCIGDFSFLREGRLLFLLGYVLFLGINFIKVLISCKCEVFVV